MILLDKSKKSFFFLLFIWVMVTSHASTDEIQGSVVQSSHRKYSEATIIEQIDRLKESLSVYRDNDDTENEITAYKEIGGSFQLLNQFDSAIFYYEKGGQLAGQYAKEELHSSILYNLGLVYSTIGQYALAIENAQKGLEIDRKLNNPNNISAALNGIAITYQRWEKYEKALEFQLKSIQLSEESENYTELANGYYNLGSIYCKLEKVDKGLEYFELAQRRYKDLLDNDTINIELKQVLSETLYSIGGVYQHNGELATALSIYEEALAIKKMTFDKLGMSNIFNRIGTIHLLKDNYTLALANLFKALQFKQLINDKKGMAITFYNIAQVYIEQNNVNMAEKFFKKCVEVSKINNDKEILKEAYLMLSEIYDLQNNHKEALKYHKLYNSYADSSKNDNTTKIIEELSLKYETERKEKENQILQRDNQIQALKIKKQTNLFYMLAGIGLLTFILTAVLYILYRSKKRTNEIISAKSELLKQQNLKIGRQSNIIELKNRDLTDSIRYAQKIQESMLVRTSELNKALPESFILLKPKDIVSGDFYWFGRKNNLFIFSAIDCTGHGVPGAFMSMLGNSYLDSIVYKGDLTAPNEILDELNKSIQSTLKQSETHNQDGMDMAICTIDLNAGIVEFSGARNPLVYIQNNELVTIKGDRTPIGRSYHRSGSFNKHTIKVDTPTSFYMFSDGYVDQFGGADNSKFKSTNLKKLLLKIQDKTMDEQKSILDETIESWKNGQEQIDDILVVGFKVG